MAKTCIVCGNPAGSKEHVFPAALGGRRTNSGIYCTTHDNNYSGLVGEIAGQIDFLNAYLGVRPDHSDQVKVVYADDPLTGAPIAISANEIKFTEPRVISSTPIGEGTAVEMAFPDRQSANRWVADLQGKGYSVTMQSKPTEERYLLGSVHHRRAFGGECGLGAVAYVAQTFFAQEFSEIARSGALSEFIAYTQAIARVALLGGCKSTDSESEELSAAKSNLASALLPFNGSAPVWWDFRPTVGETPNAFEFGHRVIVGVDASDGQIYGRISLFSALNFAIRLGAVRIETETREVTIDIDPLAEHPPNDIRKSAAQHSAGHIDAPHPSTDGLAEALRNGAQKQAIEGLLERLTDYQLIRLARTMATALAPLPTLSAPERRALITQSIEEQSQQVWRAVTYVIDGFKAEMIEKGAASIAPMLDMLIAYDARSASGLTQEAQAMLSLAKVALADQMEQDFAAGALDEQRIAELMGRGPGLHIVGSAVLNPVLHAFQRNA
ncbi:HNH endonuclease [Stenotrophomonas sp. NLF4-10]|uniref:HNH endonuclease n=1 Tax=Stenotrophomonas sp. NLF4-10 TaxID=2918754 RepID=UPI001EFB77F9|nr:HNH endonuclease [Stenotrophomonas sp. NLF4-10]MCG8277461.1 HNH endonuclease [Stenotrophomonas sp. NLF4-10]